MKRLLLIVGFVVFYFTLAVGQTAQRLPEIRFRLIHDTIILVPVEINGQGPFVMVLDTGTDTTLVDIALARKLTLPAIDRTRLNTVAGSRTAVRTTISSLAIGPARAENIEALVQDLAELRNLDSQIVGIIGQNVLSRFNYMIDYKRHSLQLEAGSELLEGLAGERVPFTNTEQRLLISGEVGAAKRKVSLVLDSATSSVILFPASQAAVHATGPSGYRVTTTSGNGLLSRGLIQELRIGSEKFQDLAVALPPVSPADNQRPEDGLLPTSLFHSLYVNNSYGFVIFNCRSMHRQ